MGQVLVLGHRGAPELFIENSLESISGAIEIGADGVEVDVRLTADDRVVLWHDESIPNPVGGSITIREATLDQLRGIDLREALNWQAPEPVRIATLSDALEAAGEAVVDIELKNLPVEKNPDTEHLLARLVAGMIEGREDLTIVTSFWTDAIDAIKAEAPGVRTGWLLIPGVPTESALPMAVARGYNALLPEGNALSAESWEHFDEVRHEGLVTWVWTVDEAERIAALIAAGVDGIITNHPERVLAALGRR